MNSFLESINDYLRLKDEELALDISALRVEGYEVEGINEEIDKVKYNPFSSRGRIFCLNVEEIQTHKVLFTVLYSICKK